MLLAYVLMLKYAKLAGLHNPARVALEIRSDLASLTAMTICATIVLVAVLWQSLYPTLRDYLSLAAFPVSGSDIFMGKFVALLLTFAAFILVLLAPYATVYCAFTHAPFIASLATMASASSLAFFGLIAVQGALLNILPARMFERVMIWLQALLAAAGLSGMPLAAWKGPQMGLGSNRKIAVSRTEEARGTATRRLSAFFLRRHGLPASELWHWLERAPFLVMLYTLAASGRAGSAGEFT